MEYLMTYGWAILVIVIVLAVLMFLNPFKAPETCLFQQPGFSCSEAMPQVYTENGQTFISMKLFNKFGQNVKIHKVLCTTAAIGDVQYSWATLPTDTTSIGAGASYTFASIPCVGPSGNQLELNPNSDFKGVVSVWYNFENDPDENIKRQASATLVTTVLQKTTE
jgi:hypothetical protein